MLCSVIFKRNLPTNLLIAETGNQFLSSVNLALEGGQISLIPLEVHVVPIVLLVKFVNLSYENIEIVLKLLKSCLLLSQVFLCLLKLFTFREHNLQGFVIFFNRTDPSAEDTCHS